ncbi:MAG: hypothetical protein DIJKHBIC_04247 [Thermoanaerobaculia bacterium]|nr:hypothetical protein [Thermoanaerobaculia bacterium]
MSAGGVHGGQPEGAGQSKEGALTPPGPEGPASPSQGEATRARTPALHIELKIRQLPPFLEVPAFLRQAAAFSGNPSEERVWIPIE